MKRVFLLMFVLLLTSCGTSSTPSQPNPDKPTPTTPDTDEPTPAIDNQEPSVKLNVKTTLAKRGIEATVTATDVDGDRLTFEWSFGDGTKASDGEGYTYSYRKSGTYTVTVKVSDGKDEVTAIKRIKVEHLRPAGSPDVVIFGFAGRCGLWITFCIAPDGNTNYLSKNPYYTLDTVQDAFDDPYVLPLSFRSNLVDNDNNGSGYVTAQNMLNQIKEELISDFDNPSRLVLVAHSHGNQFASLLAWNNRDIDFDYFIYLDGVCRHWDTDHLGAGLAIRNRFKEVYGSQENYPYPLNETNSACDTFSIPSYGSLALKDVVPENVLNVLEIQSNGVFENGSLIRDDVPNRRADGSRTSIYTVQEISPNFTQPQPSWGHSDVAYSTHPAMKWVAEMIETIGLSSNNILTTQSSGTLPTAPEGFEYYQGE